MSEGRENNSPSLADLTRRTSELLQHVELHGFDWPELKQLQIIIKETRAVCGYKTYDDMSPNVGVSAGILRARMKGDLKPSFATMVKILAGIRTVLKAHESPEGATPVALSVEDRWVEKPSRLSGDVNDIAERLARFIERVKFSNDSQSWDEVLNPVQRAQLIAALETALAILKTPLTPPSFLRRVGRWLVASFKVAGPVVSDLAVAMAADKLGHELEALGQTLDAT